MVWCGIVWHGMVCCGVVWGRRRRVNNFFFTPSQPGQVGRRRRRLLFSCAPSNPCHETYAHTSGGQTTKWPRQATGDLERLSTFSTSDSANRQSPFPTYKTDISIDKFHIKQFLSLKSLSWSLSRQVPREREREGHSQVMKCITVQHSQNKVISGRRKEAFLAPFAS